MVKTRTIITVISKISERPAPQQAALVVIYGLELGRKYDLSRTKTTVGRSSRSTIQVDQESVSRHHAELKTSAGVVTVRDLESTNGTYVNDSGVTEPYTLQNGDLVKIGRTIFKYIAGGNIESAYHDEIYKLTTADGLTEISNRRYFEEALEREVSRCMRYHRPLSLVMMDLDHFKQVNDLHGHLAGDYVLKQVASVIKSKIRREDTFARYGGEEFALLLPELTLTSAKRMAEKTRKLVAANPYTWEGTPLSVTLSLGVAALGEAYPDGVALVKAADAKLYEAKAAGRNSVCS